MSQSVFPEGGAGRRRRRKRHPNYRLAKIYRTYTVEEIARLYGAHRNTVRRWIKHGLPTIDRRRPILVHGGDLAEFLRKRRCKNKRKCQSGEIYCVRCRKPRQPAGDMADYKPLNSMRGNLVGICPVCHAMIYRCVSLAKLEQIRGGLEITMPQASPRIDEISGVSVNGDFNGGEVNYDRTQRSK